MSRGKLRPRIVTRKLGPLTRLEQNARFMTREMFDRLVENLRVDGVLTSMPLIYSGGGEYAEGRELVVSGNHRVDAAVAAGIDEAQCLLIDEKLPPGRLRGLQLSHNSLTGEDDPATLKQLYDAIDDVDWREYAGLDDKTLQMLAEFDAQSLAEAALDFVTVTVAFFPDEVDAAERALAAMGKAGDRTWGAAFSQYDAMLDALASASGAYKITNVATAFDVLLRIVERHLTDLQDGYVDPESLQPRHAGHVGLETVFGTRTVPAVTAAGLVRALKAGVENGDIEPGEPWALLDRMIGDYLAGGRP